MKDIILQNNLNCTEDEFNSYINNIDNIPDVIFEQGLYSFDEKFNGIHLIENLTGNPNAKYYVLKVSFNGGEQIYLQYIKPFVNGNQAITDDNFNDIINEHKEKLSNTLIDSYKIQKAIEYFRNK